jgi:hypothetical protein
MLAFPMVIVTILTVLTVLVAILSAGERFGGLPPEPGEPVFGKAKLIDNGARLLTRAGRAGESIEGYLDMTLRAAGRLTRAPDGLDRPRLIQWLDNAARRLSLSASPSILVARARRLGPSPATADLLALARDIRQWKMELEHGPVRGRRHSR